jgi:hypothetical protein
MLGSNPSAASEVRPMGEADQPRPLFLAKKNHSTSRKCHEYITRNYRDCTQFGSLLVVTKTGISRRQ